MQAKIALLEKQLAEALEAARVAKQNEAVVMVS
jgi:hypothetical protein